MKITDLTASEDDFFTNKIHPNIKDHIARCKTKIEALRKEYAKLKDIDLVKKYFNIYTTRVPNATLATFNTSPEHKQLEEHSKKIKIKIANITTTIAELNETIKQLKIQDLFNTQQSEFEKNPNNILPIPTVIPRKIQTGPQTYIDNPYFAPNSSEKFVGSPWDYAKFRDNDLIQKYGSIVKILQKLKEPTFSILYVSRTHFTYSFVFVAANYTILCIEMKLHSLFDNKYEVNIFYKGNQYSGRYFIQKYQ